MSPEARSWRSWSPACPAPAAGSAQVGAPGGVVCVGPGAAALPGRGRQSRSLTCARPVGLCSPSASSPLPAPSERWRMVFCPCSVQSCAECWFLCENRVALGFPSPAQSRFWELSEGFVCCGLCFLSCGAQGQAQTFICREFSFCIFKISMKNTYCIWLIISVYYQNVLIR